MQKLWALRRKSAVLLALANLGVHADKEEEQGELAEALVALADAAGTEALPRMLRLLCRASAALLCEGAMEAIALAAAAVPGGAAGPQDPGQRPVPTGPPSPARRGRAEEDEEQALPAPCAVTLEGLDLAQSALEDFVTSYFPLHGLDPDNPREVLRYLPTLAFVEGHIYDLDQANEDSLLPAVKRAAVGSLYRRAPAPAQDCFGPLRRILRERGWLSERVEAELASGPCFWELERQLCRACMSDDPVAAGLRRPAVEEALRLKSFDYRVMNLLLYAMRCAPVCEEHMAFLACSEVLVEVGDDLADYAEDVERNSFNVYRCFVALYGPERGPDELRGFIGQAEAAYAAALPSLGPELAAEWRRRCQESRRHGLGSERGPGGGDWELPPPIDEVALRRQRPAPAAAAPP